MAVFSTLFEQGPGGGEPAPGENGLLTGSMSGFIADYTHLYKQEAINGYNSLMNQKLRGANAQLPFERRWLAAPCDNWPGLVGPGLPDQTRCSCTPRPTGSTAT